MQNSIYSREVDGQKHEIMAVNTEVVRRCCKVLDDCDNSLVLTALFSAVNPHEKTWVSIRKQCRVLVSKPFDILMNPFLQENYKTWYCMPPSSEDAAHSGGNKKRKAAPGSLLQSKTHRLDSGQ